MEQSINTNKYVPEKITPLAEPLPDFVVEQAPKIERMPELVEAEALLARTVLNIEERPATTNEERELVLAPVADDRSSLEVPKRETVNAEAAEQPEVLES